MDDQCAPCDEIKIVPISKILINPYQPRREFKREDLEELAESIVSVGIIHPPLVRYISELDVYELISGERRFRASQMAHLTQIPVHVRRANASMSAQAALIENIQRVDLNPLEIAKALKALMVEFSFNQDELASKIGKKRSTLANYLRLLTLPQNLQDSISKNFITMGHAKAILALENEEKQMLLHELILRDELSVREAEKAASRIGEKAKRQQLSYIPRDFYLEQLEKRIQEKLGTRVFIQAKGKKGRLMIDYYNYEDLDRLLVLFGVKEEI